MEEHIKSAGSIRDTSINILDIIHQACNNLQITTFKRQIEACEHLIGKTPLIDVAVIGQFKAGKSSFINSLIDMRLLPVGVIPVTTVITRIKYGEKERAVITHFDGTVMEIPLDALEDYTSEAKNPANEKNIEVVDIELPSLQDYDGLRIVDTPGLGSIFKYHMEVSENWLPEVGAALLAISADRPLSENDMASIRELIQYTPQIVLLLTKVDLLSNDQKNEIVAFFKDTLRKELNREFPIYLYSVKDNVEKYRHRIEMELLVKFSVNRDLEFRKILQYKIKSLAKTYRSYLEIAYQTSLKTDADRESLRLQILGEKTSLTNIQEELIVMTRAQAIHTRTNIDKYLDRFKEPLTEKLIAKLENDMQGWRGNLWKLTRRYEEWLYEQLVSEIDNISVTEHKHFFGTLLKAQASLERYLASFQAMLGVNIERVLGVKMVPADWKIEITEPARPDITIGRVFDFHCDLLWFLIPMTIFGGLFKRHFVTQIPKLVYVNFSRLAAQWEVRINKVIEDIRKQAATYIRDEIITMDALLSKASGQTEDIQRLISGLDSQLIKLN
jgi:GTPase Era involved in 16S rRNA processing